MEVLVFWYRKLHIRLDAGRLREPPPAAPKIASCGDATVERAGRAGRAGKDAIKRLEMPRKLLENDSKTAI